VDPKKNSVQTAFRRRSKSVNQQENSVQTAFRRRSLSINQQENSVKWRVTSGYLAAFFKGREVTQGGLRFVVAPHDLWSRIEGELPYITIYGHVINWYMIHIMYES